MLMERKTESKEEFETFVTTFPFYLITHPKSFGLQSGSAGIGAGENGMGICKVGRVQLTN